MKSQMTFKPKIFYLSQALIKYWFELRTQGSCNSFVTTRKGMGMITIIITKCMRCHNILQMEMKSIPIFNECNNLQELIYTQCL